MFYLIVLVLFLAPAYALRFHLFGLPVNALMVGTFAIWGTALILLFRSRQYIEFGRFKLQITKSWLAPFVLLACGFTLSLFLGGVTAQKIAQYVVLFLQPLGTFFLAAFAFRKQPAKKYSFLFFIYLLLGAMGLLAVYQYFTLELLPLQYWGNTEEPKRAVAFFSHPNFYALFSAPLLALLIPDIVQKLRTKDLSFGAENLICKIGYGLGLAGLLLSLSRAGWLGFAAAVGTYAITAGDRRFRKALFAIGICAIIVIAAVPNLRYRFILPFMGEKSAVSRLSLWDTGRKAIQESPFFGLGLTGFAHNWERLNTDPNIDRHNFPHNIFLNFWVETGAVGLLGFASLLGLILYRGIKNRGSTFQLGVALFAITLLTQGMIDNPYLKNDLAMIFWLVLALAV